MSVSSLARHLPQDPRYYQIGVLTTLLVAGLTLFDFDLRPANVAAIVLTALAVQGLGGRLSGLARFDARSALISACSLCLLLRTGDMWLAAAAAAISIGSKFVLRVGNKHIFNPTNIGIVALLLVSDRVWVSPAQWGSTAFVAFLLACMGTVVVTRAVRADITLAFLAAYAGLLLTRAVWLGDPLTIPLRQLQNGALLIFAFFMISDPRSTPDRRSGRIVFAVLVALVAWYIQFRLFRTNGLLWALAVVSPLGPIFDRLWPGTRYDWSRPGTGGRVTAARRGPVPSSELSLPDLALPLSTRRT